MDETLLPTIFESVDKIKDLELRTVIDAIVHLLDADSIDLSLDENGEICGVAGSFWDNKFGLGISIIYTSNPRTFKIDGFNASDLFVICTCQKTIKGSDKIAAPVRFMNAYLCQLASSMKRTGFATKYPEEYENVKHYANTSSPSIVGGAALTLQYVQRYEE